MTTAAKTVTVKSTMQEILEVYPSAQRAMFQKFHIGGCSHCGFQPTDTLEQVLRDHGVEDTATALDVIRESHEQDERLQIAPKDLAAALTRTPRPRLFDVRTFEEHDLVALEGSEVLTQELAQTIKEKFAKDAPMIFFCHHGIRSLDAAAYFAGHGFVNARSLRGGIDAWAAEVDPKLPRY